jgi:hypothetical protein
MSRSAYGVRPLRLQQLSILDNNEMPVAAGDWGSR